MTFSFKGHAQEVPIYFLDYKIKIYSISHLGDTIISYNSLRERFHFVFYDFSGKCYCEKYIQGKLVEKGFFTTSGKISEEIYSVRNSHGQVQRVQRSEWVYPMKNGEWHIYENDIEVRTEKYVFGVLQK